MTIQSEYEPGYTCPKRENLITTDAQQIIAAELELSLGLPWQESEPVAERIAARLASTSPAPDAVGGCAVPIGWRLVPEGSVGLSAPAAAEGCASDSRLLKRQLEAAPEAVVNPSRDWQEEYADWYETTRDMIAAAPQPVVVESGQ